MSSPCVVHDYLIDKNGNGKPISEANNTPSIDGYIRWSHIEYNHPDAFKWLLDHGVDETVAESLTRQETRPRALTIGGGSLLILRVVNLNPGQNVEDMVSLRIWIKEGRIITLRQRRVASIQDIRKALDDGVGPSTEGEFITMLIERIADRIGDTVNEMDEKITRYEGEENCDLNQARVEVSALRRKTAEIRRFLAPQREALDALHRASKNWLTEAELYYLHEQADRITRYVEDLDLARERTIVLQEEMVNRVAQEQNSRTYLLSIVAAIFLPLSFLTGVFGMNVAGLPGTENSKAFFYLSISMLVLAVVSIIYMRIKRWL